MELVVAGHRIAVHEFAGAGPPVLVLPATGGTGQGFRRLARAPWSRRVLAIDLLGYGDSEPWRDERDFRLEDDLAVVDAVCEAVGAAQVDLVGHSYGGRVALRWALEHPAAARRITVYEPVVFGLLDPVADADARAELARADADGRFLDPTFGGTDAWLERFVDYWNGPGAWAELDPPARAALQRSRRKVFHEVAGTIGDDLGPEGWTELRAPTLVIFGRDSTLAGRRAAQRLAQALPAAQGVEFPAGHMGPATHARAICEIVGAHLAG